MEDAWDRLCVDEILAACGNMDKDEALLVMHFHEVATDKGCYRDGVVAMVATYYAQMVWLRWFVGCASRALSREYPILLTVSTVECHCPLP